MITPGQKIEELRKKKGLTKGALAKKAGVHNATITHAIRDQCNINSTSIRLIAEALGTNVEFLISDEIPRLRDLSGKTLGESIRDLMMSKGMRVNELSKMTKTSPGTIFRIIKGERNISPRKIRELAKVLDVPFEVLWDKVSSK